MISLHFFTGSLAILTVVTAGMAYRALTETHRAGSRTFGFLMSSMSVWTFFYFLEIILPDLTHKIIARKILYIGMTVSPALWLAFAIRHTALGEWWAQRWRTVLLTVPGFFASLLGMTNESHRLIWQSLEPPNHGSFGALLLTPAAGFWVYNFFSYTFIIAGILIYANLHLRTPALFRRYTGIILLGVFISLTANIIFLSGIFPTEIDPTPLSFALSAPLLAVGFFRLGLFNLFPVIAPLVIEHLRDAVITVDETHHITNINRAGRHWLNLNEGYIGAYVFDVLPKPAVFKEKWDMIDARIKFKIETSERRTWYDAAITHLYKNDGVLLGRVITFHDITQEQELLEAEFRHSTQMGLLEETGRQIADALTEIEVLQRSVDLIVQHFGYAEAAISLLTKDNHLEVTAISGTQDYGYKPSFRQKMGAGIIGHTAKIKKTYIAEDVTNDPYYFSNDKHEGSAIGIPLMNEKKLLGVLYIESAKINAFNAEARDVQTLETMGNQISSAIQRARLYADTQEHLRVMSAVQSISQVISSSLEMETICTLVVKVLHDLFNYSYISIYLLEDDHLHLGGQIGYPQEMIPESIYVKDGISGRAIQTKQTQFIKNVANDPLFLRASPDITSEICVPLLKENLVLGTLNVESGGMFPLEQKDIDILKMLAGPVALAVDNARLHTQVKTAAMTDAVTGISNRRAFEEALRIEMERVTRSHAHLSLIIFDLDSFKDYNDAWGHPAGDERLKATADLIRANLRKYDVAARYGGDEFAIILPDTDHKGALDFAKRILSATQKSAPKSNSKNKSVAGYTLSMGVATYPEHGKSYTELLFSADHAEMAAKRLGKNQIFSANELKP